MKAALGLLTAALAFGQPQFPPVPGRNMPVETGKASIEGRVVDSLTHTPIAKASVTLTGRTFLRVVTGADGHFAFRQLPAGPYTLQAQAGGPVFARPLNLDLGNQAQVSLAGEDQKTVELSLTPGGSLRGRIVDEDGSPMSACNVTTLARRPGDGGTSFLQLNSAQSDDQGEYHMENVPAGRYYVVARCFQSLPMPHALIRRDSENLLPRLTYAPLFYPASHDPAGATRVRLAPGIELAGIDFQMQPATGFPVRGHVQPLLSDAPIQINLRPHGSVVPGLIQGAPVNPRTGEFVIPGVRPGSYELIATVRVGQPYWAQAPVEVAAATPEPIDVMLAPLPQVTGSITVDGDLRTPLKNLRVFLNPVEGPPIMPVQPAPVQEDGGFTVSVPPGRWRLQVNGGPGYVKSVTLGDQEVSATALDIGPGPAALKIVFGTKTAEVQATISDLPPDANSVTAVVWPTDGSRVYQNSPQSAQTPMRFSLSPGRYYGCAIAPAQAAVLLQQDAEFRKALAGHCASLEVAEDSPTTVQLPFLPADEVKRLADNLDGDDSPAF